MKSVIKLYRFTKAFQTDMFHSRGKPFASNPWLDITWRTSKISTELLLNSICFVLIQFNSFHTIFKKIRTRMSTRYNGLKKKLNIQSWDSFQIYGFLYMTTAFLLIWLILRQDYFVENKITAKMEIFFY